MNLIYSSKDLYLTPFGPNLMKDYSYKMSTQNKKRVDKCRSKTLEEELLNTNACTTPSASPVKKRKQSEKAKKPKVNLVLSLQMIPL